MAGDLLAIGHRHTCRVACFIFTNPFIWPRDFVDRIRMFSVFRPFFFRVDGREYSWATESVNVAFARSFHSPDYTIFPLLISVPLAVVGVWHGLSRRDLLARVGCIWLLTVALSTAVVVYQDPFPLVSWGRYVVYVVLAIHIFIGNGIWAIVRALSSRQWASPSRASDHLEPGKPMPRRKLTPISLSLAILCLLSATSVMAAGGVITRSVLGERDLWQEYILAKQPDEQIDALNRILARDPHARQWYTDDARIPIKAGQPLTNVLAILCTLSTEYRSRHTARHYDDGEAPAIGERRSRSARAYWYEMPHLGDVLSRADAAIDRGRSDPEYCSRRDASRNWRRRTGRRVPVQCCSTEILSSNSPCGYHVMAAIN